MAACAPEPSPPVADDTVRADSAIAVARLIDSTIPPAVAGQDGWNYYQSAEADLTGDGQPERIVLTARVELYRGRPAWDDGQPWQVYVETADGARRYVYAQRLQLGTLTLRIGDRAPGTPASIVLLEQLPGSMSVYEATATSDGTITAVTRFRRALDPRGQQASPMLP